MTAFLALSLAAAPAGAPNIRVGVDNAGKCTTIWNDEQVDSDTLLSRARAWPDKGVQIHIDGDTTTPYRCVGGAVYTLQSAGFTKIGFIAEPPGKGSQ
jgi:biopolymer transport protein ExbD